MSSSLRVQGFHLLWRAFPDPSPDCPLSLYRRSYNPGAAVTAPVWAPARSLATTCAITIVLFSSGYLDVSVPRVRLMLRMMPCCARRVAPFGNPRINEYLPLRAAYRSLSRPSSPPRAKASFMCPCLLSFFLSSGAALRPLPVPYWPCSRLVCRPLQPCGCGPVCIRG